MKDYKIGDLLKKNTETIIILDNIEYKQITVKLYGKGVALRGIKKGKDIGTKRQYIAKSGQLILSKIDARNGAFGLVPSELDGAIVTSDFPLFECNLNIINPNYFNYLVRTKQILDLCIKASKGTTNRQRLKEGEFLQMSIKIPSIDIQEKIVENYLKLDNKLREIRLRNRENISILNEELPIAFLYKHSKTSSTLADFLIEKTERIGKPDSNLTKIGVNNLEGLMPLKTTKQLDFSRYKIVNKWDFIYNPMRVDVGSIGLYQNDTPAITSPDYVVFSIKDSSLLSPNILLKYLKSRKGLSEIGKNTVGSVRKRLYFENLCKVVFPKIDSAENNKLDSVIQKIKILTDILNANDITISKISSSYLHNVLNSY